MQAVGIEIHAGHWGNIYSGANGILNEVREARKVGQRVHDILKSWKVPVTYFEDNISSNQSQNLNTLVNHHNKDVNDLVVSIHFNSNGATTKQAIGTEVLYYSEEALATKLSKAISDATGGGLKNRGAKQRKDLAVLVRTYEPAVLIEVCFVNSEVDAAIYRRNFEKICQAIAKVLAEYVRKEVPKKEDEEMVFTSKTLRDRTEFSLSSRSHLGMIVEDAIKEGASEEWREKHENRTMTKDDYKGLAIMASVERQLRENQ